MIQLFALYDGTERALRKKGNTFFFFFSFGQNPTHEEKNVVKGKGERKMFVPSIVGVLKMKFNGGREATMVQVQGYGIVTVFDSDWES